MMAGEFFKETVRRYWRQAVYWGVGIGLLGLYVMVIIRDVDMLKQYAELVATMPPALLQAFGIADAAAMATPEGFINFGFYSYSLLILAVFAVMVGMSVTANEEDDGVLDVVLSLPVPRWRVVVEKFLAFALIAAAITVIAFGGLLLGMQMSEIKVDVGRLVLSTLNLVPSLLLMIALTVFCGAIFHRRTTALAAAAVVIVASYFINFLGASATGSAADALRAVSFFAYYDSEAVMRSGLNAGNIALLLAATAALVAGAVWAFQRRDIGV